jgi:hypothetical protein
MMYRTAESIIEGLKAQGFVFSQSTKFLEGKFEPADAEWNYKDVPHLKEIHELVEGVPGAIEHNYWAGFFVQKIGPFRIPISIFNYAPDRSSNLYFVSIGPFALIIKSKWNSTANSITKVTTEYNLGSLPLLRSAHRIIHRLLGRNYQLLMEADLPMRLRRGDLRARGYQFLGDSDGNGFLESTNLSSRRVLAPSSAPVINWTRELSSVPEGSTLIGSDDVSGIRVIRSGDSITLFPRICMHEGAKLDDAQMINDCLVCPWHGKLVKAVGKVVGNNVDQQYVGTGICATTQDSVLMVVGKILK